MTTDPIDPLHEQCIEAREGIRGLVEYMKTQVAQWEPRPLPEAHHTHAATRRAEWEAHLATGTATGAPRHLPYIATRVATDPQQKENRDQPT